MSGASQSQPAAPAIGGRKRPPTWVLASAVGLLVAVVVALFASAFVWPMKASDPKNIPFGLAGDGEQLVQVEEQLGAQRPDLFDIATYEDRGAVVQAIERREIDGGLVVTDAGMEMLTASAGSPQVSQMLTQLAAGMTEQQEAQAQQAMTEALEQAAAQDASAEQLLAVQEEAQQQAEAVGIETTDVVAGGELAQAGNLVMLPALIGGVITAMLSLFVVKRPWYRIVSVLSGSLLAGLSGALVLGPWMGVLTGSFGMTWLALSAGGMAISATIMGLGTLLGNAGIGLGVVLMMLVGNPWGGMLVPSEFLGGFMGWLGSHMPNGNVITVVKNITYFPEASQTSQWWVFGIWAAIGLALWLVGASIQSYRSQRASEVVAV